MSELIAKVAVENTAYSFDGAFDYAIPDILLSEVKPGVRVSVPFGNGNSRRQGIVFALREPAEGKKLKLISSVLDSKPVLNEELIRIASFLKENTFCTLYDAAKAMLPAGIGIKFVNSFVLSPTVTPESIEKLTPDEKRVVEYLSEKGTYVKEDRILKELGFKNESGILAGLCKKGYLLNSVDASQKIGDSTVKMARLSPLYTESENEIKLTPKQKNIVKLLEDIGTASVKEICYFTGLTSAVVSTLYKKGVIELYENKIYRRPKSKINASDKEEIKLNKIQNTAYNNILKQYLSDKPEAALLYGVTGSGKTQVYLKLADKAVSDGKSVIVMVPEISLTPQMLDIFYSRYGDRVAVFHSGLSMGERKDEWDRVNEGKATIVLGTRSAVFAPVTNLGLIVIDEEQESTYKSEMTPRYNAKDVAAQRVIMNKALLLLSSATPSVTAYAYAKKGIYSLNVLDERFGEAQLPEVITADIKYGADVTLKSNLSVDLYNSVKENLENGKQTILLLNRRGFNTFASCSDCGKVRVCPNCSISLTYHSKNQKLMCHYCGYSEPFSHTCPECGNNTVVYSGTGTQKLEDELAEKFPEARILRLDTDSVAARYYFEEQLNKFAAGEYDILLGTQMVAKGLDFPNVTLVGVISIDQQLFNDDYKSAERAFDLLTQVVGRSGRGAQKGRAIIQTGFPDNEIIRLSALQDYESFYNLEIKIRKALVYPPFCDFCSVGFVGSDELMTKNAAKEFHSRLQELHKKEYSDLDIILLNPITPRIARMSGKYRYRVVVKCKNTKRFRQLISTLLKDFANDNRYKKVTAFADMNPESMF